MNINKNKTSKLIYFFLKLYINYVNNFKLLLINIKK